VKHVGEISSIDDGRQIDSSAELALKTNSPSLESLQPASNLTLESDWQLAKHDLTIVSIDDGIQIDSTDEQYQNADWPRLEISQSDSNRTDTRELQNANEPFSMVLMSLLIVTSRSLPKHRGMEFSPRRTRHDPMTRRNRLSGSTTPRTSSGPTSEKPRTSRRLFGSQIEQNEEQHEQAHSPRVTSRAPPVQHRPQKTSSAELRNGRTRHRQSSELTMENKSTEVRSTPPRQMGQGFPLGNDKRFQQITAAKHEFPQGLWSRALPKTDVTQRAAIDSNCAHATKTSFSIVVSRDFGPNCTERSDLRCAKAWVPRI
jgi:hypothetical protein